MRLLLLRHGETEATERHLYCGSSDLPLSEAGLAALAQLRESGKLPDISGVFIVSSPLLRCRMTLRALFDAEADVLEPRFREVDFGLFELHGYEELCVRADYQAWLSGDNEKNIPPCGESGAQMQERVSEALRELVASGRDTLLVSHGGVIACIMAVLFPTEERSRYAWQPKPGHGYELTLEGGEATRCRAF